MAPEPVDNGMAAIIASKAALRKSMTRTLRALSDADIESQCVSTHPHADFAQAVARRLLESAFFLKAGSIGCYLSMPKAELRTGAIVDEILRKGKTLYTPYIPPRSAKTPEESNMRMLRLYSSADLEACPRDSWGIPDPGLSRRDLEGQPRADVMDPTSSPLDVILVPGVAFDQDCNRLGHGKGYYDRFLKEYTQRKPAPLLVGLALECQVLRGGEKVPVTDTDFAMDAIVFPEGVIWQGKARN